MLPAHRAGSKKITLYATKQRGLRYKKDDLLTFSSWLCHPKRKCSQSMWEETFARSYLKMYHMARKRASLGKFAEKSFAPPNFCLLLHLWCRHGFSNAFAHVPSVQCSHTFSKNAFSHTFSKNPVQCSHTFSINVFHTKWKKFNTITYLRSCKALFMEHNFTHCIQLHKTSGALSSAKVL